MKKKVKIKDIIPNKENPRFISDNKFKKLVQSIQDFPEMLDKRPLVVDENLVVLGGNMRLRALQKAGIKEIIVDIAKGWTDKQKKEFIIKDNIGFGDWDWDILANSWNVEELKNWGLDLPYDFAIEPTEDELKEDFNVNELEIKINFENINDFKNAKNDIENLVQDKYKKTRIAYKGGII